MTNLSIDNILVIDDLLRENQSIDLLGQDINKQETLYYIKIRDVTSSVIRSKKGQNALLTNLQELNKQYFSGEVIKADPKPVKKMRHYKKLAIAAGFIFVLGTSSFWYAANKYCDTCIASQFATSYEVELRSSEAGTEDKMITMYKGGQFVELIAQLKNDSNLNFDTNRLLLLANAYYKIGQYDQAINTFTLLPRLSIDYKAEYYYGVISSLMAKGEMEKAYELNQKALVDKHLNSNYQFTLIDKALSHPLRRLIN